MSKDLITVHEEDTVTFAEAMMRWEKIRQVPVENDDGELVGMLHRYGDVVQALRAKLQDEAGPSHRRDHARAPRTYRGHADPRGHPHHAQENLSALPVVRGKKLKGIITASDFMIVAARLLE